MLGRLLTIAFAIVALAGLVGTSHAQYVYLDANGDGIWSTADRMNANGVATTVDAWINTNHNKGGSLAVCNTADGDLGFWNSYAINLQAVGGTVSFTNFINQQSTFTLACVGVGVDFASNSTEMTACRATPNSEAGGLKRMFTVTVTGLSGVPSLQYLALGNLSPNFTSYGTPCSGNDFDNTYKLGSDFFDNDGLVAVGGPNTPPTLTAPTTVNGSENAPVSVAASASDPDAGQLVTLTQTNNAPFLAGPASAGPSSNPSITLSGTPNFNQAGTYTVNWTATDNSAVPTTSTTSTSVVIANVNRPPTVTAPATASGNEGTLITFTVSAVDPDGDPIGLLTAASSPATTGSTFTPATGNSSGTFSWTPTNAQAGTYTVTFTAANNLTGTAATVITVANVDGSPVVTAPATAAGNENTLITYTVSASDPDGQAITSLTAASSPATTGSTFTAGAGNTSGTFSWTPTFTQAGTYTVTVTASNALSGSATTTVTVTNVDRAPTVTAPATASGAENTLITFAISANDPDGQAITSLTRTSNPPITGSTFAINASNSSATWSWTPNFSNQGTYFVDFTASNTLQGSARTTVTVTNVDRPPTVTAPATQTVSEGALLSFSVTANDPDSDAFTSLTSASSPPTTGSTFTVNASNNFGGFEWTPSFTQAGSYTTTFTAVANGVSATASTAITVNNVDRAPTVTAPGLASGTTGSPVTVTVTAVDPDGNAITSLTEASSPATTGSTFTAGAGNTSGTFSWTPSITGTFTLAFTASNALSGSAATTLTVTTGDRPPTVTAPATQTVNENVPLTFTVAASDPDGNAITSLTASSSPAATGSTFTANASNTSGTFSWTPSFTQAGSYTVTFTASNALTGTAATAITVNNVDRPPVVVAPATQTVTEGSLLSFGVTANDPDGSGNASFTATSSPPTTGSTFTTGGSFQNGTFSWTPTLTQAGNYTVTFTASNALTGTASTAITVNNLDRAPVVTAPATANGSENTLITFTVSANDPDGEAITSLTAASSPATTGSTFTAGAGNTSGTFSWTPSFTAAGSYTVTFTATNTLSGSASTAITVGGFDRPPVVTAPGTASGNENTLITFSVSANDPDGQAITSLTASSSPATTGSTFAVNASHTSATWSWTPSFTNAGTYSVDFTASNSLSGTARTTVAVANVDRAPTVTAPATASGDENTNINFNVTANDPDGDAISSLTAASSPPTTGSVFTVNASNGLANFSWTPSFTQAGSYTVTFFASNGLTGTASTAITVNNVDRAPVVTAPAFVSATPNIPANFVVTANDPDGDAITSLTASSSPATTGSTFTTNVSNTSGTFSWTPSFLTPSGMYFVTFTASNTLSGSASTQISVTHPDRAPVVTAPATASGNENTLITYTVTAADPDGQAITSLTASSSPATTGSTFTANGTNTSGTWSWTPSFIQAGTYTVTIIASNAISGTAATTVTVNDVNRAPVADAGGPYTGVQNFPVQFHGSGSSDPDGDALSYLWDFGDGGSSTEPDPMHTYTATATYNVSLMVSSGSPVLSDTDNTTATITDKLGARAFTLGGNSKTSLGAGKPFTCFQVEPVGGSYDNSQVLLATVRMIYPVGSTNQIFASGAKTGIDGDKDGNGVTEITACFAKEDMRVLFAGLPAGNNVVTIEIEGDLAGGGSFSARLEHTVKSNGGFLAASISPNPLNPRAKLSFSTTKPGAIRVQMFDPQGRLVKTIAEEPTAMAGYHDYTIDGRSGSGTKLASGVYFVKVWSEHDGDEVRRITILK